jgi:hypothetical protein
MYNLLTNTNRKIKKTAKLNNVRLYEFNLTAVNSCPFAKDCIKICYADKGTYKYKNVQKKYEFNYELTKKPNEFHMHIQAELISKRVEFVRIHSSGDFYSLRYLKQWIAIAEENPNIVFYGYTKSVPLFKAVTLPKNFIFCFSLGGKMDHLIEPGDKKAVIFDTKEELKKARFVDCSVNDMKMIATNRIGLIKH